MIHPVALRLALMVTGAFLLIILVWATVITLSARVDTHRLTPSEEAHLLQQRGGSR